MLSAPFDPDEQGTATLHMTTLLWMHFSSYSNARQWGPQDSIRQSLTYGNAIAPWMTSIDSNYSELEDLCWIYLSKAWWSPRS